MVLYTVKVDTEKLVAQAIDQIGAVIVSVQFDSLDDLCSASFEQYMRDAVATVLETNGGDSESESNDVDGEFESVWREFELEVESRRLAKKMEDEEKVVLATKKRQEAADLAVAMELQAREAGGLKPAKKVGWASGLDERLKGRVKPNELDDGLTAGFPALPKRIECMQHSKIEPNSIIQGLKKTERHGMSQDEGDADAQGVMKDWRVHCGDLDGVLGSKINDADRSFILGAAAVGRQEENGGKNGISPNSFKKMMRATDKTKQSSTVVSSVVDRDGEIDRDRYSRKNIRKLVLDMVSAGWRPLTGRGGGHYMYERVVELDDTTKYKQLLVLACTPSDVRNIDIVYARLLKCDREAEELKRCHRENS
eukprot:jgi/Picsp_1/3452/NSC_06290-R1_---NA---